MGRRKLAACRRGVMHAFVACRFGPRHHHVTSRHSVLNQAGLMSPTASPPPENILANPLMLIAERGLFQERNERRNGTMAETIPASSKSCSVGSRPTWRHGVKPLYKYAACVSCDVKYISVHFLPHLCSLFRDPDSQHTWAFFRRLVPRLDHRKPRHSTTETKCRLLRSWTALQQRDKALHSKPSASAKSSLWSENMTDCGNTKLV